ncbi:unnamed protein product [Heligmosomoides polygyrus]|uniref:GB1/RHD3-type G domain-containing protein n=1 Tax=Heligmosomoides polygyrus TaxID=6339 RepID=A0A3P8BAA9_HELPZ|nr:unnamed protein product [Heligmosomoides polygyrus]
MSVFGSARRSNEPLNFFQQELSVSPDQPEEIRCVREQLSDCFEQISCFLLPHPGYRVAERQSFRGHVKDLRPIFREELKKMVPSLLNPHALQPKLINGKPVTCRKLMQYFKEYVSSFDGNTLPEANSILNANAKLICIEAAHEAKVAYCRGMDRVPSGDQVSLVLINIRVAQSQRIHEELNVKHFSIPDRPRIPICKREDLPMTKETISSGSFHDPRPVEVFHTKPSISWKCSSGRCGDVAVSPPKSCILCKIETDQGIDLKRTVSERSGRLK